MWTSKITGITKNGGRAYINVDFINGTEIIQQQFVSDSGGQSLNWLKNQINSKIAQLEETYVFADSLTLGDFDSTIPTPTPTQPTQAEIDRQTFFKDYNKWKDVKKAIDMGILTGNEIKVVSLLNKVKAEFKPEYLEII